MRRRHAVLHEPPAHLRVFDPCGADEDAVVDVLAVWCAARKVYYAEHGWPGGFLVMLLQHQAVRSALWPDDDTETSSTGRGCSYSGERSHRLPSGDEHSQ